MTTSAGNVAARSDDKADKEKVEKRRALGRGLESLLPGPRVVPVGQSSGAAGKQQIPFGSAAPGGAGPLRAGSHFVRNDKSNDHQGGVVGERTGEATAEAIGEPVAGFVRAEVEENEISRASSAPHLPVPRRIASMQAVVEEPEAVRGHDEATLKSPLPAEDARPFDSAQGKNGAPGANSDETITIYAQAESRMPANLVVNLAIADIDKNPFQTRYVADDDALEELADSIKANGVVQPIMVRPGEEDGRYILVLGERRLLASKKAGKTHIPAMVRRVSLQQAAEMTIVENLQREDLSALEQAEAFRVLSNEFHLTQQQIGERVGLSRASITNYMRLLKLPREVMQLLAEKKINFAQARELLKLEGDDKISEAALFAVKKGMTVEQVEMLVLRMNGLLDPIPGMPGLTTERKNTGARWVDPNVRAAQMDLERTLGVRVRIRDRKGKGKIVIEYHTVDDYERVVEMLRGKA
jgi:ParB family chromosome partitioning protein